MPSAIQRLLQRPSLHEGVRRALESGVGLYHTTWRVETGTAAETSEQLAAELLAWCREMLGRSQRPYGLDRVTLALAALGEDGRPLASIDCGLLGPADFSAFGPVEAQTREVLRRWNDDGILARSGARLSVVLFSWGDLTWELLLAG